MKLPNIKLPLNEQEKAETWEEILFDCLRIYISVFTIIGILGVFASGVYVFYKVLSGGCS